MRLFCIDQYVVVLKNIQILSKVDKQQPMPQIGASYFSGIKSCADQLAYEGILVISLISGETYETEQYQIFNQNVKAPITAYSKLSRMDHC